jgi:hypothetical protein
MRAYKRRLWLESIGNTTCRVKTSQAQRKLCFSGDNTLERCFGELRGEQNKGFLGENRMQIPAQSSLKNK